MAIRLSKVFASSADMWLGLQMDYGLAHVEKKAVGLRLKRLAPKATAA
jgi:plasmid maintenance system antidote protein VapI